MSGIGRHFEKIVGMGMLTSATNGFWRAIKLGCLQAACRDRLQRVFCGSRNTGSSLISAGKGAVARRAPSGLFALER
jgi:hypothetical protein